MYNFFFICSTKTIMSAHIANLVDQFFTIKICLIYIILMYCARLNLILLK